MNDALIIVVVVLFVGVFAGVVFVVWRTRYQPVNNPFRTHKDDPPAEQVILRSSDFSKSSGPRDSRTAAGAADTSDSSIDDVLRAVAIGQIATHLTDQRSGRRGEHDSVAHPPQVHHSSENEITGRADDPASDPFSSDSGASSHDTSSESGGSSSGDSGGGSDSGSGD